MGVMLYRLLNVSAKARISRSTSASFDRNMKGLEAGTADPGSWRAAQSPEARGSQ